MQAVKTLGGELVETVQECTHLISDQVRRTAKFLCQAARGHPIVDCEWLENSKHAGMFLGKNCGII